MLPKIIPSRLQRAVADKEFHATYPSFEALCEAVAEHEWAKKNGLDADLIGKLIIEHETITKVAKPSAEQSDDSGSVSPATPSEDKQQQTQTSVSAQPVASCTIYDGPGRGRKQCPQCEKYVGVRNARCVCGHDFAAKKNVTPAAAKPQPKSEHQPSPSPTSRQESRTNFNPRMLRIDTPAGACPYKLDSTEPDVVIQWAEKIREREAQTNRFLTARALTYYVRQFFDLFSPEHAKIKAILQEAYTEG